MLLVYEICVLLLVPFPFPTRPLLVPFTFPTRRPTQDNRASERNLAGNEVAGPDLGLQGGALVLEILASGLDGLDGPERELEAELLNNTTVVHYRERRTL